MCLTLIFYVLSGKYIFRLGLSFNVVTAIYKNKKVL